MNLRYSIVNRRFEAQLQDFQADLAAVKAAGFKTDGAPEWVWHTQKIPVLLKLQKNRPPNGVTIDPEALVIFNDLKTSWEANEAVRTEAKKLQKAAKKEQKGLEREAVTYTTFHIPEGKIWLGIEDLPYKAPWVSTMAPPAPPPALRCVTCSAPVYIEFETVEPFPLCLWCEKTLFDPHKSLGN